MQEDKTIIIINYFVYDKQVTARFLQAQIKKL